MEFSAILSPQRRQRMRSKGIWPDRLITDYLDEAAERAPDAVAVVGHNSMSGEQTRVSYAELQHYSIRIACGLASMGVERSDVVAVQLPNWWHYAAVHAACVRIGAVINPLMPIFRERELEFMLGFAEARVAIVAQQFRGFDYPAMYQQLRPRLPQLKHVLVVGGNDPASAFEARLLEPRWETHTDTAELFSSRRPKPDDVTEIMYTSGTTGQPKGVMHTANTLMCKAILASELFALDNNDVVFMGSPLAHQTGFMYACVLSMFRGAKCVLQDIWNAAEAVEIIARERCTITLGSTPFLSDLLKADGFVRGEAATLRVFLCAGAPIPSVLVEQARAIQPGMHVMSAWGMTEMGIATATYPDDAEDKVVNTDGRALPHQAVRVVDAAGKPAAVGTEGRLQSRCATTFVGYLKRPADYGVDDAFWLETGDNARMDEHGYIRITGRSKDIIIRGGENIPVVEVEQLLYRHEAVEDAAIVAMPDARLGERACAFVSLRDGQRDGLDFASMLDYLESQRLARQYWPEQLEIIGEFPRTASGKIQKFKLREMATTLKPARA